jgi:mono/diheme cytochrome c family protein
MRGYSRWGIGGVAMSAVAVLWVSLLTLHAQEASAKDTYLDKCSVCHGADGAGKTAKGKKLNVKDVRAQVTAITAAQMVEIVSKGKDPNMDGYAKSLSPAQIQQIVDYYRSLAKP